MNGWLLVRIAGIVVGIATLLRVATNEGVVTYDPLFLAWMDRLRDIVELGFLTDLIGPALHWGINWVRSLGISVPDLQDEWRPAFVLSMLMFGAVARHARGSWLIVAAPTGAITISVWCGLTGSYLPFNIGFGLFFLIVAFFVVSEVVALAIAVAAFALVGAITEGVITPLVALAATSTAIGATLLLVGIYQSVANGWQTLSANRPFNIGLDILFTMASAFLIAIAAANPPIW